MNRTDNAEPDLDPVERRDGADGEGPSDPPSTMDRDLERLLIAVHEAGHL